MNNTVPHDESVADDARQTRSGGASRPPQRQRRAAPPRKWPRALRKDPMEAVAMALIGVGVVMMCQPVSIALFGWSFLVVLSGTIMFLIVSHFPE